MSWRATIANLLWVGSSLPALAKFQRALVCPAEVQQGLLRQLLLQNRDCAFGRLHNFRDIRSYRDFADCVPIATYDDLEPWIERISRGEPKALTNDPVTHLIPTSGSAGARKLIPFTDRLQTEFNAAIGPWIGDLALQHPGILRGKGYWSITPATHKSGDVASAVPIGFADDASYLGGAKAWLVRTATLTPDLAHGGADLDEFRFQTLLCLLRERELRLISVWHPSFLLLLLDALPIYWEKLLSTIEKTHRARAGELERTGFSQPESLWPKLCVISCWGDGHAELGLTDLRRRFPSTHIQPKGLLATEAFVSFPFQGAHPLAVCSHFFEFLDLHGQVRLAHELEAGEIYEIVVTTGGGLWRYRLGDLVEVTGFVEQTCSLRFIGRAGCVSDRFGEKLTAQFVGKMLDRFFARLEVRPKFTLLAPEQFGSECRYTLFVQRDSGLEVMPEKLEAELCANPQYAECRRLGQLQPAAVFRIRADGFAAFAAHQMQRGCRLGDIKPEYLSKETGWEHRFVGDYVTSGMGTECEPNLQPYSAPSLLTSP